ncbi:MAG: hypothetical protein OEY96_11160 [Gammaproteobacteria bacterium]|nr:hypothetical protein [Gammaproteobacteria bacterium]
MNSESLKVAQERIDSIDLIQIWLNFDPTQKVLLVISLIFMIAQGIYFFLKAKPEKIKGWRGYFFESSKYTFENNKNKITFRILLICFYLFFLTFGIYSAYLNKINRTNNSVQLEHSAASPHSFCHLDRSGEVS